MQTNRKMQEEKLSKVEMCVGTSSSVHSTLSFVRDLIPDVFLLSLVDSSKIEEERKCCRFKGAKAFLIPLFPKNS